jgi:uncharacterized membrane protein
MNATTLDPTTIANERVLRASVATRARIQSIDLVRGLVIMLMALDHVRDYFSDVHFNLTDPTQTTPGLYITRWITHLCAPTFIFLAGVSAYRMSTRMNTSQLSRFLLTRGLWLIVLEITVIVWAWSFNFRYDAGLVLQVMWAIGASMMILAALVYLPIRVIAFISVAMIAGHNLLDPITPASFGSWAPLWKILHVQGRLPTGVLAYPLIPWIGVMSLGYAMGTLYDKEVTHRRKLLCSAGISAIALFVALRLINVYGDPHPWQVQSTIAGTWMSFLAVEKYPPSLLYLLATLGIAWLLLAAAESLHGIVARVLNNYGRVPLFFYVGHIVVAHLLAGIVAWQMGFGAAVLTHDFKSLPPNWGLPLPLVYGAWFLVLAILYPACRWYGEIKRRRNDWWLSYV